MLIQSEDVIFNPEVRARVAADNGYPSVHWPLDYPNDNLEDAIRAFQMGVLFRIDAGKDMPLYGGGPIENEDHRKVFLRVYEIVTLLESAAFYRGYHLATGLAAGNCRSIFCAEEKRCWPMVKGRACIHPNIGRPSMVAAGIDTRAMAEKLGWTLPADEKNGPVAGLVMVA